MFQHYGLSSYALTCALLRRLLRQHLARLEGQGSGEGGRRYRARDHKSVNSLNNATENPFDNSRKQIHWTSDNPLTNTDEKCESVGKLH